MIKKTITYIDYDGNEVTEDFYFHLSKARIIETTALSEENYLEMLKEVATSGDPEKIMSTFRTFILNSYGVRPDNKRFIQSKQLSEEFAQTEAYSEIFAELCTNADAAVQFVTGVFPLTDAQKTEVLKKTEQLPKTEELPSPEDKS